MMPKMLFKAHKLPHTKAKQHTHIKKEIKRLTSYNETLKTEQTVRGPGNKL